MKVIAKFKLKVLCVGMSVVPAVGIAQDAGTLLRQQELPDKRQLPQTPPQPIQVTPPVARDTSSSTKIRLKSVRFTGAERIVARAELDGAVMDAIDKELDIAGLQRLADRITQLLKSKGYFLGRAYLPQQDVTSGALEIRLVPGVFSASEPFRITGVEPDALRIDLQYLAAIANAQVTGGNVAHEADIERPVLLMGDIPGITAKARLAPGVERESTTVFIDVVEGALLSSSLSLDNYGNRNTGDVQLNGLINVNDAMHIGDQIGVAFVHAEGFDNGRMSVSVPLGAKGTRLSANASRLDYRHVNGLGVATALRGNASTVGLALSHPVIRSRESNLNLELDAVRKLTQDNSSAGNLHDKVSDSASIGLHADHYDDVGGGGLSLGNLTFSAGNLDLSANSTDAADDARTYRTQGAFSKLNWGVSRLQKLDGTFTFYANLVGQSAFSNLGSSEQIILGGPYGVRAYPGGEAAGDSGWLANLELRYDLNLGGNWGNWQLMGFYDVGHIALHQDSRGLATTTSSGANEYQISGWGMGVQLNKNGSHTLRVVWAQKIGSNPGSSVLGMDADGRADSSRLWFTGTMYL